MVCEKRKMIVHRMLDNDSSHNDSKHSHSHHTTNKMTNNNRHNQNYQLYCNRDRNKLPLLLLLIAIFMCKCCAVTGDPTGKCLVSFILSFFVFVFVSEEFSHHKEEKKLNFDSNYSNDQVITKEMNVGQISKRWFKRW